MSEFQKDAKDVERSQRRNKRSNSNEANQPRDTLWNRVFYAGYSTYVSLSRGRTRTNVLASQVHSFRKPEDVCVSSTSNILTDRSGHKCRAQFKQSDHWATKTGQQMVSVANTEERQDAIYYLSRRNADGEFGREDTPPPPRPPKSKYKAHQSLRRWIESGEYMEFLRRREHGEWNWFGRRKRRKKSPAQLKMGARTRGCTSYQSSDRQVRVQPVTTEADFAGGIDAATCHRQLKSLLVDKSEPSPEKLMHLSCELKNYIALRRQNMQEEMGMTSTKVAEADESQRDMPSSLAPSSVVSPDDAEPRSSVNSRSGLQSLTENANASSPRSVRKGGGSVRSPRLLESRSSSALSWNWQVSSSNKHGGGRGKRKNKNTSKWDPSLRIIRTEDLENKANRKLTKSINQKRKDGGGRGKKKDLTKQSLSSESVRTSTQSSAASGMSAGTESTNNLKPRGYWSRGKKKNEEATKPDRSRRSMRNASMASTASTTTGVSASRESTSNEKPQGCCGRGKKKNEEAAKGDMSRASKRTSSMASTMSTETTTTGVSAKRKSTILLKPRGFCNRGNKKSDDETDQDLTSELSSEMSTVSRRSKQSSYSSYPRKSSSKRDSTQSAPPGTGKQAEGGGGVRKASAKTTEPPPPFSAPAKSATPAHIPPNPNNGPNLAYSAPNGQMPVGMHCCCSMCPIHGMAFMHPQSGQLTINQTTHTPSPPPPTQMATSAKEKTGATRERPSQIEDVQCPDQGTSAISVKPPNGPSSKPIVNMASADLTEQCRRATGAPTHTIEIQFHGEQMSSVTVSTAKAAAGVKEQSEGTKSSASPATFRSDVPAAAATSRSLSMASVSSRPSKLSGRSSYVDDEQEGDKGCCGKGYCKKKPEAKHNDSRSSTLFDRSASKTSTNTVRTRPSQRRSLTSCYRKPAGAGTQSGQKTLRLTNAYMSDDGRKPEFAQPFEYSRCRSASYGMAAPYENGLPGAGMQAHIYTEAVNPQPSRFTCVNARADKATQYQPAFHSAVTDFTEQNEATRPWMPRRADGRSPDDVCSPTPTADTRFIVGERPVSPAGARQGNTPEKYLAGPCNDASVECSMESGGFGQQFGPNGFMGGPGQTVWVLIPMAMGANGMVGMPASSAWQVWE